jgi:bifunctional DNA-binding transcriptional regulator/antitoxin component of YhaV-PrlF toxin-antitoxin module
MNQPAVELSRLTVKGQCTLPRRIREYLGVGPGDHVAFVLTEHGVLVKKLVVQSATPTQGSAETALRERVLAVGQEAQARGLSEAEVERDMAQHLQRPKRQGKPSI